MLKPVLVSYYYELPPVWWLKTMQIYLIPYNVWDWKSEVGLTKLESRFWQSWIPFRAELYWVQLMCTLSSSAPSILLDQVAEYLRAYL